VAGEYGPQQRAAGKIEICIKRLLGKYPFHARILERFKIMAKPDVGTVGVTVAGNDVLLLHSPDFVLTTPSNELVGVLLHEVHHVLFGHVLADPAKYSDQWARTIAEEVTVNEFVKESLPAGVIRLEQFPDLPAMESTDERYARLKRRASRDRIIAPIGIPASTTQGASAPATEEASRPAAGSHDNAKGNRRKDRDDEGKAKTKNRDGRTIGSTVDDHSVWREARKDPSSAKAAVEAVIFEAALEVGMENVPEQFRGEVGGILPGDTPGEDQYELQGDEHGQLDWRHLCND